MTGGWNRFLILKASGKNNCVNEELGNGNMSVCLMAQFSVGIHGVFFTSGGSTSLAQASLVVV